MNFLQFGRRMDVLMQGILDAFGGRMMQKFVLPFIFILGFSVIVLGQRSEIVLIRLDESKPVAGDRLTVKFLSIVEDSRCPADARCIWAGNAKIRISVAMGKSAPRNIVLNSNLRPRSTRFSGWEFTLEDLVPQGKVDPLVSKPPLATIRLKKL